MKEMQEKTFHIRELFLLASAFGAELLFGLPDRKAYQLKEPNLYEKANESLIQKGILDKSGKITDGGVYVIRTLELYYLSKKYVRIHNVLFGFQDEKSDEIITLLEVEENTYYRLSINSKAIVLKLLTIRFPLIIREPGEEEKDFTKKKVPEPIKKDLAKHEPKKNFMNIELFHLDNTPHKLTNTSFYQQWFIFIKYNTLFMIDPMTNRYYIASQYWFLKVLFDALDFPYKEANLHG